MFAPGDTERGDEALVVEENETDWWPMLASMVDSPHFRVSVRIPESNISERPRTRRAANCVTNQRDLQPD